MDAPVVKTKKDKKGKGKVKLTPEEIEARKAQAAAKKGLKDIAQVLSDMTIMNKNGMPYFCKDYDSSLSYEDGQKRLNLLLSQTSTEKYSWISNMCLCIVHKYEITPDSDAPEESPIVQKLTILMYIPSNIDGVNVDDVYDEITKTVFPEGPSYDSVLYEPVEKAKLTADLTVGSCIKDADLVTQQFRNIMKDKGIYVEVESDDDDMGQMIEDAGIEW
jgi:hypothetical protein